VREAVIVEAVRTPVGKRNGGLSGVHAADLSALVLTELADRTGLDPAIVDDVVWGCVSQVGDQSSNIGRFAVLAAGWPETVPGTTVNRACGSSQQALDFAAWGVMSGQQDVVVAGGVETMSRVPLGAARQSGFPYGPKVMARYDDFPFWVTLPDGTHGAVTPLDHRGSGDGHLRLVYAREDTVAGRALTDAQSAGRMAVIAPNSRLALTVFAAQIAPGSRTASQPLRATGPTGAAGQRADGAP